MLTSENTKKLQADSVGFIRKEYNGIMANEDPKFYGKDGFCTAYAHSCGYMDSLTVGTTSLSLKLEHSAYTVSIGNWGHQASWTWHASEPFARLRSKALFRHLRKIIIEEHANGSRCLIDSKTVKDAENGIQYLTDVSAPYRP